MFSNCYFEEDSMTVYAEGEGGGSTPLAEPYHIEEFRAILDSKEKWSTTFKDLLTLRDYFHCFPVRRLLKGYSESLAQFSGNVNSEFFDEKTPTKLSPAGEKVIGRYINSTQGESMRLDMMLAFDAVNHDAAISKWAQELRACVNHRSPKYSGKIFRVALNTPYEIFMMRHKLRFVLTSFVTAYIDPNSITFKSGDVLHVVYEIDTSEFPYHATLIEQQGRKAEVLLSCYNIYQFVGYRVAKVKSQFFLIQFRLFRFFFIFHTN